MKTKCLICGHIGRPKVDRGLFFELMLLAWSPFYIFLMPFMPRARHEECRSCGSSVIVSAE